MTRMTDKERETLRNNLTSLDAAEDVIRKARKPFDSALHAIEEVRAGLLESHEINGEIANCGECGAIILEGEPSYSYEDGPILCADDAPTWGDVKSSNTELLATADADTDPDDIERANLAIAAADEHVAGGGSLADKVTYPL